MPTWPLATITEDKSAKKDFDKISGYMMRVIAIGGFRYHPIN